MVPWENSWVALSRNRKLTQILREWNLQTVDLNIVSPALETVSDNCQ